MTEPFFPGVEQISYEGPASTNPLAFRHYQADKLVLGKTMAEHLRFAVCYWHSFAAPGDDVFGAGTFDRPWLQRDDMPSALTKLDAAFEFFTKLSIPYFCFHDRDVAPEGASARDNDSNLRHVGEALAAKMQDTGVKLLWGTANLFSHPRYAAGAATNPDPTVFAYAAAQVKAVLELTNDLGGENYVLWGGREGYESLLNTDLKREGEQLARFLTMVAEYKHHIGFPGTLLLEPKPQEPTKHQYDYDCQSVHGFLVRHGLEDEFKVNIEVNHATLAGHSFHHEVSYAIEHGIFGSVDANRGDPQNGWDTDQFPNSVEEMSLSVYEILRGGGFSTGGFMFDTKLRRQSMARVDLFHGHIGGIDTMAKSLLVAERMIEGGTLEQQKTARYAGWDGALGTGILGGAESLASLQEKVASGAIDPSPVSGQQELIENLVNQAIWNS